MAAIENNVFAPGFAGASQEFANPGSGAAPAARAFGWNDSIEPVFANGASAPVAAPIYGSGGNSDGGLAGFGNIMNGFLNALQNFMSSLAQQFGLSNGSGSAPARTYFTNATASSVGDPHDAFDGTETSGAAVDGKWDSMRSHSDLLDSDSFAGGYQVATTASAPSAKGIAYNASASVALGGGATSISMNGNGSYSVTSNGANVALTAGQSVPLGNGESVTLGRDKSLTVAATNAAGGTLSTVLSGNGSGVDVKSTATGVDLGGYLVNRTDTPRYPVPGPVSYGAGSGTAAPYEGEFGNGAEPGSNIVLA